MLVIEQVGTRTLRRHCRICREPIYFVRGINGKLTIESCGCRPSHCSRVVRDEGEKMELLLLNLNRKG